MIKRTPGRPKLPEKERLSGIYCMRFTPEQLDKIKNINAGYLRKQMLKIADRAPVKHRKPCAPE